MRIPLRALGPVVGIGGLGVVGVGVGVEDAGGGGGAGGVEAGVDEGEAGGLRGLVDSALPRLHADDEGEGAGEVGEGPGLLPHVLLGDEGPGLGLVPGEEEEPDVGDGEAREAPEPRAQPRPRRGADPHPPQVARLPRHRLHRLRQVHPARPSCRLQVVVSAGFSSCILRCLIRIIESLPLQNLTENSNYGVWRQKEKVD